MTTELETEARRARRLFALLVTLLWLAVVALAGSLVQKRFFAPRIYTLEDLRQDVDGKLQGEIFQKVQDKILGYGLAANAHKVFQNVNFDINSGSFRDREFPLKKPDGVKRIVALGDSFTFGMPLPLEVGYVKKLEQLIWERTKPGEWEVLNFGVSGYQTVQEVQWFEERALQYSPDVVIFQHYVNDALYPVSDPRYRGIAPDLFLVKFFDLVEGKLPAAEAAELSAYVASYMPMEEFRRLIKPSEQDYFGLPVRLPMFWENVVKSFRRMRELSEQHHFKVIFLMIPSLDHDWGNYPFENIRVKNRELAFANGFLVLDLLPVLSKYDHDQLRVSSGDGHTNEFGNEIVSRALDEFLKRTEIVP